MARMRSVRRDEFAFPAPATTTARTAEVVRRGFSERTLRRSIPCLIALFFLVTAAGSLAHFTYGKELALDDARSRLALTAETIAAEMAVQDAGEPDQWQNALSRSLPGGATGDGRRVLVTDPLGRVRATAPLSAARFDRPLAALVGGDPLLTTFGARAGVIHVTLPDGRPALATARDLLRPDARLVMTQPVADALERWWREVVFDTTIFATTGLLLILIVGAFWSLSAREGAMGTAGLGDELQNALARSGVGLWDWNVARGQVRWSRAMFGLLGRAAQETALPFRDLADAVDSPDRLYAAVESAIRAGEDQIDRPLKVRHADGHWLNMRLRGDLRRAASGEPHLAAVACLADAADRPAEAAADAPLKDAIEAISEAFVLWDADNRLVMCNQKYRQFHSLSDEAVRPGAPYEKVIGAGSAPVVRRQAAIGDGSANAQSYEIQIGDGRWLHVNERRTKDGGFVSIGTDITELKKSEQSLFDREKELNATVADLRMSRRALEQQKQQLVDLAEKYALEKNRAEAASRSKSEFLANMSHELRTPLNAVIGFSEVMKESLFGPIGSDKYAEYARDIHASGRYLLEVINDILDMSKIEAGRMNLSAERLDVGDIIDDSIRVVSKAAADRAITLKRAGLAGLEIEADRRGLKQIVINLLSNAVKFTPERGQVTVKLARRNNDRCAIAIADTGIGIPKTKLGKLGRPFEQVENQFTKSRTGSGLGLAISRSLLEMHGGHLEIASREGKGTTVTCVLPVGAVLAREDEPGAGLPGAEPGQSGNS